MPIYEFHCNQCGREFEYLVLGSDKPVCPKCKSKDVCKMMSTCGFVSKGGGGQTTRKSASASSCGSCTAGSCAGCGH